MGTVKVVAVAIAFWCSVSGCGLKIEPANISPMPLRAPISAATCRMLALTLSRHPTCHQALT
jgi:hypothetical protein